MTAYTAWWALDEQDVSDPAEAEDVIEQAWSRVYPHGGRGVIVHIGPTPSGQDAAPLRIDIDILEGRAAIYWTPDDSHAIEPDLPSHPRPLTVAGAPDEPTTTVPGIIARVTPGAALLAAAEYIDTGQRPSTRIQWLQ